jgi:hypothetical protein
MVETEERPIRLLTDTDGRIWHVYVVIEGYRWDPEIEERRRNWLCLESGRDRRFISPVPDDWQQWSEAFLLQQIRTARPDLRGP